jgi:hypothetical protein
VESRRYLRHPSDIPIEYSISGNDDVQEQPLADVGLGGLSFCVDSPLSPGQHLKLSIPSIRPDLQIESIVSWCEKIEQGYQVGIEFLKDQDRYTMRMVEQICYIEAYRHKVQQQEGRQLSTTEAAEEWIRLYAQDFPQS